MVSNYNFNHKNMKIYCQKMIKNTNDVSKHGRNSKLDVHSRCVHTKIKKI